MNFVQPIREIEVIEAIKEYLKQTNERDYIFFIVGINTGLRVSDILTLQVGAVKGTHIPIREGKTGKQKLIPINPDLRAELKKYTHGKQAHEYLFQSRSRKINTGIKGDPISRDAAYKMLNKVALQFNLTAIGTHTLRKTFGYHMYSKTKDVALLMDIFNHSHPSITLRYIGMNQDIIDTTMNDFRL
jgi:integrase